MFPLSGLLRNAFQWRQRPRRGARGWRKGHVRDVAHGVAARWRRKGGGGDRGAGKEGRQKAPVVGAGGQGGIALKELAGLLRGGVRKVIVLLAARLQPPVAGHARQLAAPLVRGARLQPGGRHNPAKLAHVAELAALLALREDDAPPAVRGGEQRAGLVGALLAANGRAHLVVLAPAVHVQGGAHRLRGGVILPHHGVVENKDVVDRDRLVKGRGPAGGRCARVTRAAAACRKMLLHAPVWAPKGRRRRRSKSRDT
jgi:hypothetical protein